MSSRQVRRLGGGGTGRAFAHDQVPHRAPAPQILIGRPGTRQARTHPRRDLRQAEQPEVVPRHRRQERVWHVVRKLGVVAHGAQHQRLPCQQLVYGALRLHVEVWPRQRVCTAQGSESIECRERARRACERGGAGRRLLRNRHTRLRQDGLLLGAGKRGCSASHAPARITNSCACISLTVQVSNLETAAHTMCAIPRPLHARTCIHASVLVHIPGRERGSKGRGGFEICNLNAALLPACMARLALAPWLHALPANTDIPTTHPSPTALPSCPIPRINASLRI